MRHPPRAFRDPRSGPVRPKLELAGDLVAEIRGSARPTRREEAVAHADRAVMLLERGDTEGAIAEATRAKAAASRSATVREILALAHYAAEDWRQALREMQAYRRMSARLDQNHIIADCHRAMGKPEQAFAEAERALDAPISDEVKAECVVVGAAALADLERYEQALALLRRFPTRADVARPFDLRIWYVTGDILARLGRTEEAAREFQKVVRHEPAAFDAAERLAALG